MKVNVQSVHFDADKKLIDFVQDKVSKLGSHFDIAIKGDVVLKVDKSKEMLNKTAEIKVSIPGTKELFAKKQSKTFEEATDTAVEALRKQIVKHKDKIKG